MHSLQRVQNTLARLILNPDMLTPSLSLLKELHWLPVQHRITYKIATLTHTALQAKEPSYLYELLTPYQPPRLLRSSDQSLLNEPRTKLHLTDKSFHTAAPSIWNKLPHHLRTETNTEHFRKNLKTHLFSIAFDNE